MHYLIEFEFEASQPLYASARLVAMGDKDQINRRYFELLQYNMEKWDSSIIRSYIPTPYRYYIGSIEDTVLDSLNVEMHYVHEAWEDYQPMIWLSNGCRIMRTIEEVIEQSLERMMAA